MSRHVAIVTDSTAYLPPRTMERHGITSVPLTVVLGDRGAGGGHRDLDPLPGPGTPEAAPRHHLAAQPRGLRRRPTARSPSPARPASSPCTCPPSSPAPTTRRSSRRARHRYRCGWWTPAWSPWHSASARWPRPRRRRPAAPSDEAVTAAEKRAAGTSAYFYVDTLDYLRRGGRIGAAQALLGSALAVKPLLQLDGGRIELLEKVRTASKAIARLEEIVAERAGSAPVDIAVHHLAAPERAAALADRLRDAGARAGEPACERGRRGDRGAHGAGVAGGRGLAAVTAGESRVPACWVG